MSLEPIEYIPACAAGIEIAVFGMDNGAGAPVVFVTHGLTGSMSGIFWLCRDLAEVGCIAVGVEQRNHGRRAVDPRCNAGWGAYAAADLYGISVGTAHDISLLIDMLPARFDIPTDRVGVTGISLGGHVTLMAMALDPRINAGAAMIGAGDTRRLKELRALQNGVPVTEFGVYYPEALDRMVQKYDPICNVKAFADRPLLMVNGEDDEVVPAECNQRFEAAVRPYYTDPDRLRLTIYPGVGHTVPPEMWEEARNWFRQWLVGD